MFALASVVYRRRRTRPGKSLRLQYHVDFGRLLRLLLIEIIKDFINDKNLNLS